MAIAVQQKYNSMRRPADKEKFQAKIGKSYRDMLSALKEEAVSPAQQAAIAISKKERGEKPKKESVLDRIDKKSRRKTMGKKYFDTKDTTLESSILSVWQEAAKKNEDKLDPVNKNAVKKKFDDRKDKDIDNDGDVDSSDKFLHKRRKAVSKSIAEATGKEIAAKMMKDKSMKSFASKVAKMKTVSRDDLEKMSSRFCCWRCNNKIV